MGMGGSVGASGTTEAQGASVGDRDDDGPDDDGPEVEGAGFDAAEADQPAAEPSSRAEPSSTASERGADPDTQ
jgi:hypothetical protein